MADHRFVIGHGTFFDSADKDATVLRQTKAAGSGGRVTLLGFIEVATLRQ
jgi:hypothetical protein